MRGLLTELEVMKTGYEYLFVIENELRVSVEYLLELKYGMNWKESIKRNYKNNLVQKNFENLYFHELISFLSMIPVLKDNYGDHLINCLKRICPIRNKIAHCRLISDLELELLTDTFLNIKDNLYVHINSRV